MVFHCLPNTLGKGEEMKKRKAEMCLWNPEGSLRPFQCMPKDWGKINFCPYCGKKKVEVKE